MIMLFLGVVFASTVFTRRPEAAASYRLDLFWSWKKVFLEGNRGLLLENILNVILFLPLGFLLPAARGRRLGLGLLLRADGFGGHRGLPAGAEERTV